MPRLVACLCVSALLIPLFGCGPTRNAFPPACPTARLVPALADMTRYAGPGPAHDLTDMIVQARVIAVSGECHMGGDPSVLPASVQMSISVLRGPAMKEHEVDVPVFLAVSEGNTVRDKQEFPVHVVFPPNVDRLTVTSPNINLSLPVSSTTSGASYNIIAGFQLTPEELAGSRRTSGG